MQDQRFAQFGGVHGAMLGEPEHLAQFLIFMPGRRQRFFRRDIFVIGRFQIRIVDGVMPGFALLAPKPMRTSNRQ